MDQNDSQNLFLDSSMMQNRQQGLMTIRLSNSDELLEFESKLRGAVWDYDKNVWICNPVMRPLANEEGISKIMTIAGIHANKIFYLSNFDEHEVNELSLDATYPILKLCVFHHASLDIMRENWDLIVNSFDNLMIAIFKRAMGDKERDHIDTVSRTIETRTFVDGNKGKGGFPQFNLTHGDADYGR